jgi:glycosyltransferase involved in cell wall biosynthesis
MKILIISYYFPPCTNAASTLIYNLCKHLPREWYTVLTTKEELGIHCWDNVGAYDKEYALDCNTIRLPVRTNKMRDRIMFFMLMILQGLFLNKNRNVDCLLAVYPDEFDLFGAYFLRQLTGKPLIVYMHDLLSEVKRTSRTYKVRKFIETKIFSSASAILVTNEKSKDHYSRRGIKNVMVFPSCVDLNGNHQAISQTNAHFRRNLRIVFTGSAYPANEDAILCFLKAAKKVSNVEIVFAVRYKEKYLEKFSVGFLPKKECWKLQRSADVLFLPLSIKSSYPEEMKCAFPIKALEYLAAGKPILAVVPAGSFMEEFIRRNEVGIVVTELSEKKIIDAIEKLKDKERREYFSKNALKAVPWFDSRTQSRRLYSIIEHVVSSTRVQETNQEV